ncbi:hypothetical protein VNO80_09466 [Phaseolus coccineus]|uniref:Uncharacterized protein n=1 Tax=Phaseolus coccineus TaxID=3886 RepID=A0AAN9N686_PHACN
MHNGPNWQKVKRADLHSQRKHVENLEPSTRFSVRTKFGALLRRIYFSNQNSCAFPSHLSFPQPNWFGWHCN